MKTFLFIPLGGTLLLAAAFFFVLNAFLLDNSVAPEYAQAASISSVRTGNWSAGSTWSTGSVPGAADTVIVSAGHTVTYDMADSQVAGVTIQSGGKLAFLPSKTVLLRTNQNIHNMGELEMKPSSPSIHHTIQFENIDELKYVGGGMQVLASDVGLWTTGSGVLDIAGSSKTAWARLAGGANAGNNTITLQSAPTGWQVGDELSIVPTENPSVGNRSWNGFEVRTIQAISGNTVTLSSSLSHSHPAATNPFSGSTHTAEVLNLTRNVHIQGTGNSSADPAQNGRAHVIIMGANSPQSIKYVEFRHLGPRANSGSFTAGVLGRYALHFHHSGDGVRGSVVEGTVARQAGGHAYVPHASHGITFHNTISYDTWDDAYWWDPAPKDSRGANTNDPVNDSHDILYNSAVAALLKTDPDFRGNAMSGFVLGRGLRNEVRNSIAVGVRGTSNASGFVWPESDLDNNQAGYGVWIFNQGNVSHNNKIHGMFTWQNNPFIHIVQNVVAYHNGDSGLDHGAYVNNYQYLDISAFGNGGYGAQVHSAAGTPSARADGYSQVFERYVSDGPVIFQNHNAFPTVQTLLKDCVFTGVIVNDATDNRTIPTGADFVNCTKPNGQSLEPADFTFQAVNPGVNIRVQRPNGTAYHLGDGKSVTTISPFYSFTSSPPPPPPPPPPTPDPTATFSASPTSITAGGSSTLIWSSSNATSCQITFTDSAGVSQSVSTGGATSGSATVTPTENTTYDLTCSNSSKSVTVSASVGVTLPNPTASLSASVSSITAGQSVTLTWSSSNANQCAGTNFNTNGNTSGSTSVSPAATTSYTVQCTQPGQSSGDPTKTASESVTVSVAGTTLPPPPPSGSGLVGHWKFDEGFGGNAADSSGNGNAGTIVNGPTWTTGKLGSALQFDPANDAVQVPADPSHAISEEITVSAWVYLETDSSSGRKVVCKWHCGSSSNSDYVLQVYPDNVQFSVNTGTLAAASGDALPLNQWQLLVGTYDGSTIRVYRNGTQVGSTNHSGSLQTSSRPLLIGNSGSSAGGAGIDAARNFDGKIDDVRVYNRALSASEIATLANSGISLPSLQPGDLNGDGKVDITDVSRLLSRFGSTDAVDLAEADINGPNSTSDGKIDIYDANTLMANWTG